MANREVQINETQLRYPNFAGRQDTYNAAGDRNFQVYLPEELAAQLEADGWNVKWTRPGASAPEDVREDFEPRPFVKVNVSYRYSEPEIWVVTSAGKVKLRQDQIGMLDRADIQYVDVKISGSYWSKPSGSGVTAYLEKIYAVVREDELDARYANIPDNTEYGSTEALEDGSEF